VSLQDRKVSRLLHCLSPQEQRQFLRSLPSQLIAKTQVLVTLAEGILALEDSPRALWTQMYPDTHPYDDARFRKLCELLVEKLESFLACQELEAQPLMKQNLLIQALGNRNLGAEYPKACRKIHKQLDRQPLRNLSYYRTRLVLSRMVQDHNNKASCSLIFPARPGSLRHLLGTTPPAGSLVLPLHAARHALSCAHA
jgi:hypothetical protein